MLLLCRPKLAWFSCRRLRGCPKRLQELAPEQPAEFRILFGCSCQKFWPRRRCCRRLVWVLSLSVQLESVQSGMESSGALAGSSRGLAGSSRGLAGSRSRGLAGSRSGGLAGSRSGDLAGSRSGGLAGSRSGDLAGSRSGDLAGSSRDLAGSRSRGLAGSRSRGLAGSSSRGLAGSSSRGLAERIVVKRGQANAFSATAWSSNMDAARGDAANEVDNPVKRFMHARRLQRRREKESIRLWPQQALQLAEQPCLLCDCVAFRFREELLEHIDEVHGGLQSYRNAFLHLESLCPHVVVGSEVLRLRSVCYAFCRFKLGLEVLRA